MSEPLSDPSIISSFISLYILQGIMASAAGFLIMTWCVHKRGPVFTAAFIPIVQIMVAIIDFFFLHEQLYLGR